MTMRRATCSHAAGCEDPVAAAVDELAGGAQLLMGAAWSAAGAPDLAAVSAITRISCFDGAHQQGAQHVSRVPTP